MEDYFDKKYFINDNESENDENSLFSEIWKFDIPTTVFNKTDIYEDQKKEKKEDIKEEEITKKDEDNNNKDLKNIKSNQKKSNKDKNNKFLQKKIAKTNTKNKKRKKLDDQSMRKECKSIILDCIFDFINRKIGELYNFKIDNVKNTKLFQNLNQKQISENKIKYNKDFINRTLKDIFSEKIKSQITSFIPFHNLKLVNQLTNETDLDKRNYFNRLFNLTFLQCLKHFRESEYYEELNGMKLLKEVIEENLNDTNYIEVLKYYIFYYENILEKKKSRNRNKKKSENITNNNSK